MKQADTALKSLRSNNGYLTAKAAARHGISPSTLKRMAERGSLERVARGLYVSADTIPDPFFIAQYRCPQGVFSHETALYFHDLSDRTPLQMMMTIPSGWNTRMLSSDDMMIFYCQPKLARLGTAKCITPYGHPVIIYNAQRTICDCLRNVDKLDKDLVLTALKRYIKNPSSDKTKLLKYAAIFKIKNTVLKYMEVLS